MLNINKGTKLEFDLIPCKNLSFDVYKKKRRNYVT